MKGGANIIVNPSAGNEYQAINLIGSGAGYIICEEEINRIVWWLRDGANTNNITVPFANASGTTVKIKMINIQAGSADGAMIFSTAPTSPNNKLISTGAYPQSSPTVVTNINNLQGVDNSNNVVDRFWFVQYLNYTTKPVATGGFTFYYTPNDLGAIDPTTLQAQFWNSPQWVDNSYYPSGTSWPLNYDVASIADPNISAPWVLVNKNKPLPISLLSFNAVCTGTSVNLNWSTASETNNDYFTVERSKDALLWDDVLNVNGAGNSNTTLYYSAEDNQPYPGYSYYRLKQTDFDGTSTYSNAVIVGCENENTFNLITAIQDPENGDIIITFTASENEHFYYSIYDDRGRLLQNKSGNAVAGTNEIHINAGNLSEGIYLIHLQNSEKSFGKKILLK
jgi:hypothetical protein